MPETAIAALLKLDRFANELRYVGIAHQALAQMQPMMAQYPLGFGQWIQALSQPREIDTTVMKTLPFLCPFSTYR